MQLAIHPKSPLIRTTRKSVHGPLDEDRALARGIEAGRGLDLLPVVFGGKLIAWTKGAQGSDVVAWRRPRYGEKWWMGWTGHDDMVTEVSGGKKLSNQWARTCTSAMVANNFYDLWPVAGNPGPGAYTGSAFTARPHDDTTAGSLYHGGNVSTDTKHLLLAYIRSSAVTPTLYLYDRVLTYEACTFNASANQGMTNTLPATRYIGAGEGGLKIMVTAQTVNGATANNLTQLQYTDDAGNTLQSMVTSPTVAQIVSAAAPTTTLGARVISPATAAATLPWHFQLPLATGDSGARLIANYTTSAANTGTMCFVLHRILATLPVLTAGVMQPYNFEGDLPSFERVRDGACLAFMAYAAATTAFTADGSLDVGWG